MTAVELRFYFNLLTNCTSGTLICISVSFLIGISFVITIGLNGTVLFDLFYDCGGSFKEVELTMLPWEWPVKTAVMSEA